MIYSTHFLPGSAGGVIYRRLIPPGRLMGMVRFCETERRVTCSPSLVWRRDEPRRDLHGIHVILLLFGTYDNGLRFYQGGASLRSVQLPSRRHFVRAR